MSGLSDIKTAIKNKFEELKVAGIIAEVQEDDFKVGLLERDIAAYPAAIITTPSIESDPGTNRDNIRTYNFGVLIVDKSENVNSPEYIENLAEAILDKFDNDPTLGGVANAGVEPSTSPAQAAVSRGKGVVFFEVIIKAKRFVNLNF
jgi:hypothetical protein